MKSIVDSNGSVRLGFFDSAVDEINFQDYDLKFASGRSVPYKVKNYRYKTFHFAGISTPGLLAGVAVADIGYLATCFAYVFDLETKLFHEKKQLVPGAGKATIRQTPEHPLSVFKRSGMDLTMTGSGIDLNAGEIRFQVFLEQDPADMPVRLCTRSGYRGWTYTRKAAPVRARGRILTENRTFDFDQEDAFAVIDWTGGYLRRETWWNWAAIAGRMPDGSRLGLNLSWGTNETGFTENAFWLDSELTRVGPVCFTQISGRSPQQWHITSSDGRVDLVFVAEKDRFESVNTIIVVSRFTQLLGRFSGSLKTSTGRSIKLDSMPGWAEDHFARW